MHIKTSAIYHRAQVTQYRIRFVHFHLRSAQNNIVALFTRKPFASYARESVFSREKRD